jgi:hypothetical protein
MPKKKAIRPQPKKKELNIREKKLVKARVEGKTQLAAWKEAGYSVNNKDAAQVAASQKFSKPHIQQAINDALEMHKATPEWAVLQLKKVAEQDDELGAKRLATMNILELHGWSKNERPTLQLQVKNAFFDSGREVQERKIIDVDNDELRQDKAAE